MIYIDDKYGRATSSRLSRYFLQNFCFSLVNESYGMAINFEVIGKM